MGFPFFNWFSTLILVVIMIIRVNYSQVVFFITLCYSPLDDVSTEIEKHVADKVNHVSDNGM